MPATPKPRLGRPPSSSSLDTRERILVVARIAFADLGYGVTTNKYVAGKAGITTGALYHYFDSKIAMYRAVYDHVQHRVRTEIETEIDPLVTFIDQFSGFLTAVHRLNVVDPSLAQFLNSARIDISRHDELKGEFEPLHPGEGRHFIPRLVKLGVATGEISKARSKDMDAFLHAYITGLTDAVSNDSAEHQRAIDAVISLMRGTLVSAPTSP
jgi:AcrR family transcriptional regulator